MAEKNFPADYAEGADTISANLPGTVAHSLRERNTVPSAKICVICGR